MRRLHVEQRLQLPRPPRARSAAARVEQVRLVDDETVEDDRVGRHGQLCVRRRNEQVGLADVLRRDLLARRAVEHARDESRREGAHFVVPGGGCGGGGSGGGGSSGGGSGGGCGGSVVVVVWWWCCCCCYSAWPRTTAR